MWITTYCLLAFITMAAADEAFYQPVKGKCNNLHAEQSYSFQKAASGHWHHQYGSYGKEGDSCGGSHGVERGTTTYIDFLVYDDKKKEYVRIPNDLTSHTDRPGVYITSEGVVGFMLGSDTLSYFYFLQCLDGDPTKVMAIFSTREPEMSKKEVEVYKNITARLEKMKLLPKMHKINQLDCPPKYLVDIEKLM